MAFVILAAFLSVGLYFAFQAVVPSTAPLAARLGNLEAPATVSRKGAGLKRLGAVVDGGIRRFAFNKYLDGRLGLAGVPWTPGEFLLVSGLVSLVAGGLAYALTGRAEVAVAAVLLAGVLPYSRLEAAARKRHKALIDQLPDAVLLLATALKGGNSLLQGLQLLSGQIAEPLASEMRLAVQEINWGLPFETALNNLKARIDSLEVEMVVVACILQRQTGGNLSEILLNVHEMIRDRIRVKGDVQALTAQGRASSAILTALPPGLGAILYFLNPGYIQLLFTDPRGQMLVAGAVGMNIVGTLCIRKIVNVDF